jgi:hypothetical protein
MKRICLPFGNPFARKACPIPAAGARRASMRWRHVAPLLGFVLPSVAIGYGFVIPRSCIAGVNEMTVGFATTILGACITYLVGVRSALTASAE